MHSPRTKGGKNKNNRKEVQQVFASPLTIMGNVESSCLNQKEELRKPAALVAIEAAHQPCPACTDHRITRDGHNNGNHHEPSSSTINTMRFPLHDSLREKSWHGVHQQRISHQPPPPAPEEEGGSTRRHSKREPMHKKLALAVSHFFHHVEDFMFPKTPLINRPIAQSVRGGVFLKGCETPDQHYERIKAILEAVKDLHGSEGLRAMGLEYRVVRCDEHKETLITMQDNGDACRLQSDDESNCFDVYVKESGSDDDEVVDGEAAFAALAKLKMGETPASSPQPELLSSEITLSLRSNDGSCFSNNGLASHHAEIGTAPSLAALEVDDFCDGGATTNCVDNILFCHLCTRRLFDIASNTMMDSDNRKRFIADGDMYEAASRLVQEHAQYVMMDEGRMTWVTVEEARDEHTEPIRILINSDHPLVTGRSSNDRPTVLICTGRGMVRAGIFSRQHLMCTGLESSTAVPIVRDAVTRHLNVVIVDPNVHGEAQGFVTFQKTMNFLEGHFGVADQEKETEEKELSCRHMYVVSHSASGGHMARYFLDKCDSAFLRNIRAVAFTDSTHSIQWAKADDKKYLFDLLQGKQCVYFRCARERDGIAGDGNKWYLHPAGEHVQTDSFWRHRFGTILTMWAGTNEHSLTNWYSHAKIWEHFDHFLFGKKFNRNIDCSATFHAIEE